jgi:hypothetical protein
MTLPPDQPSDTGVACPADGKDYGTHTHGPTNRPCARLLPSLSRPFAPAKPLPRITHAAPRGGSNRLVMPKFECPLRPLNLAAIVASYFLDLPTGYTVVAPYALAGIVFTLTSAGKSAPVQKTVSG